MKTLSKEKYDLLLQLAVDCCAGTCNDAGRTFGSDELRTGDDLETDEYVTTEHCRAGGQLRHYYLTALAKDAMACYEFASKVIDGALG